MTMPIVANPELLLIGNPRRRRRRRRNGMCLRPIKARHCAANRRRRRNKGGRRGGYAAFVKRHKGLFKRMTFRQAVKKIGMMWRKKH